ncbi:hypothetical protein [Cyclobacterium sp.]|uniref:TolB family protein n=1 Tax=Cyclobacterium sp. TaxID=1966343 RepID=UPI0019BBD34D|nr:hypothetical protein [Cyclobacterium sp.]MBD3629125.1 hypothetical protein [Cyclobacterium sp.]
MDASILKDIVALDHLTTVENKSVYNIYTVEFGDQVQKKELVGSPWNDMSPVFSPANENILAFVSDRSGTRQVWTFNSFSGKVNQVSFFQDIDRIGSDTSLSWTDQGRSLALPVDSIDCQTCFSPGIPPGCQITDIYPNFSFLCGRLFYTAQGQTATTGHLK